MRLGGISLAVAGGELIGGLRPVQQERASTIEKMTYSYQIAFALTTTVRKNQNPAMGLQCPCSKMKMWLRCVSQNELTNWMLQRGSSAEYKNITQ